MSEKKFMQSETQRKKIHAKDRTAISLKPEWFPVYQRLFLRKKSLFLAAPPLVTSASGRHRRFPHKQEKNAGTQVTRMTTSFGGRGNTSA